MAQNGNDAASKTVSLSPGNLSLGMDVFVDVAGGANVPATGWGMIVNITPGPGATGSLQFNPPLILSNEPNLMPSSQNPFIDFDRDFNGKSYGTLGNSATQLTAYSYYFAPTLGPAPPLDANGNLSLPSGRGLVSLLLVASSDASGGFNITFDPDIEVTGVIFATGQPAPNDIGVHPVATHVSGLLNVLNQTADYNHDLVVNAADYVVWRKNDGTQTDYEMWRANFGVLFGSGASIVAKCSRARAGDTDSVRNSYNRHVLSPTREKFETHSLRETCQNRTVFKRSAY